MLQIGNTFVLALDGTSSRACHTVVAVSISSHGSPYNVQDLRMIHTRCDSPGCWCTPDHLHRHPEHVVEAFRK